MPQDAPIAGELSQTLPNDGVQTAAGADERADENPATDAAATQATHTLGTDTTSESVVKTITDEAVRVATSPVPEKRTLEIRYSNTLLEQVTAELAKIEAEITEKLGTFRQQRGMFVLALISTGIAWYWFRSNTIALWITGIMAVLFGFSALTYYGQVNTLKHQKSMANDRSVSLTKMLGNSSRSSEHEYFDQLVAININNLGSHYDIVTQQVRQSYRMSSISGILGFLLVLLALIAGITGKSPGALSYTVVGAGVLIEFIAAIFFYLYSKNVQQLKEYHDSLLSVQNVLLSLKMVDSVKEPEVRASMIRAVVESLVARPVPQSKQS